MVFSEIEGEDWQATRVRVERQGSLDPAAHILTSNECLAAALNKLENNKVDILQVLIIISQVHLVKI